MTSDSEVPFRCPHLGLLAKLQLSHWQLTPLKCPNLLKLTQISCALLAYPSQDLGGSPQDSGAKPVRQ